MNTRPLCLSAIALVATASISFTARPQDSKLWQPGLGEYMSGLQLHMAKMWFAAEASNWDLANYELHETSETMDAVAGLNVSRNNVDISVEIKSVLGSQIMNLQRAIDEQSLTAFTASYNKALSACNECHNSFGYRFIHVTTPSAPPVTNQVWEKISPNK